MADTFDSRLKLRLQESGGNSGQWGDLLNQTITNVASVFGFGTHQLTADSDATLTLADDGASLDALKSSYLKITSSVSLTATRVLTFSPNTFNQVKYVENNTTGGQSITLSQGSGANITIENGATKIVYFDGAGSGAAVVDALAKIDFDNAAEFTTLKVTNIQANDGTASMTLSNSTGNVAFPASIDVSGTSNLDVVDIDGAVDMASTLTVANAVDITAGGNNLTLKRSSFDDIVFGIGTVSSIDGLHITNNTDSKTFISLHENAPASSVVLDSSGNVGFNKSNPSMGIDLVAANNSQLRIDSSDTNDTTLFLDYNGGGATNRIRLRNAAGAFAVNVDNTNEAIRITSSGFFGVGTSDPLQKIHSSNGFFTDSFIASFGSVPYSSARPGVALDYASDGARLVSWGTASARGTYSFIQLENDGQNQQTALTIDASGNVGVGVVPNTSTNTYVHFQVARKGSGILSFANSTDIKLTGNAYYNSGWKYANTEQAAMYEQNLGKHTFFIAPSGTADSAISWSTAAIINNSGNVGIGTDSPGAVRLKAETAANGNLAGYFVNTHATGSFGVSINAGNSSSNYSLSISDKDNSTTHFYLRGDGLLGLGSTVPSAQLDVVGQGSAANPTLELNSSTSDAFNHSINAFNSNLTAGEYQLIVVGKEGSSKNSGYIGYEWNGAGSNSNLLTFGHWAADNLMNLTADGNFIVGGTSSGAASAVTLRADGVIIAPQVYSTAVSASLRDLQIDSSGFFGFSTSTRATKDNIEPLTDVSWLLNLEPVSFNRKITETEVSTETEYGLVADDVESVNANICFYDETENGKELVGITYSKLITPILKLVQEQQTLIESLTDRIAALEK